MGQPTGNPITPSPSHSKMTRPAWLASVISWDGCLPVLAVRSPFLLQHVLANRDQAELTAFLVIPMIAALVRTQVGYRD